MSDKSLNYLPHMLVRFRLLTAEEAEPQGQDTVTEFNVGQSEECPICIHEYGQDMSTGQVAFLLTCSLCVTR